ncbi:MAG: glucuronyl hydrolase [Bacteroidetes bacterium]|nr:MAG: glucuronyl hydrolase [Bacteroidota bacterium]
MNKINSRINICLNFFVFISISFSSYSLSAQNIKKAFHDAEKQESLFYENAVAARADKKIFPRSINKDSLKLVVSNDWTSGFFPGILWLMYENTGKNEWRTKAEEFTLLMEKEPGNAGSHDVGFKVYNSYGNGYRLTNNAEYKKQVIRGAATLATRFNKNVGCIRSWDFGTWKYPVIIDNMMNLELLFEATKMSGDSSYYKIAVSHANTTMKNHFRSDFSCYHVMDYDAVSGKAIGGSTHQGYSDKSAWARGQAWALYGFTMCYRETKDPAYLKLAENIASFLINHPRLPTDKIPYWDFDAPEIIKEPRDASAAAIMASALYELQGYSANQKQYKGFADKILNSLIKSYRSPIGSHYGFILLHSTGHKPTNGEVDTPIIYADYYFLEALLRRMKLN